MGKYDFFRHYEQENEARRAIAERMLPDLEDLVAFLDAGGKRSFSQGLVPKEFERRYMAWRMQYDDLLEGLFDQFHHGETKGLTEDERMATRQHFVDDLIELDEAEAIRHQVADINPQLSEKERKTLEDRLETYFGTVRNTYLASRHTAETQFENWVESVTGSFPPAPKSRS